MVNQTKKGARNAVHLKSEMSWLSDMITYRLAKYFKADNAAPLQSPEPPTFDGDASVYSQFVTSYNLTGYERLLMILSLAPVLNPGALDAFFVNDKEKGKPFSCFGGVHSSGHNGFLPTAETFLFIACGSDLDTRFKLLNLFSPDHAFSKHGVIALEGGNRLEPFLTSVLVPSREYIDLFTHGSASKPTFGNDFPAKELSTGHNWDDLVLNHRTRSEIEELRIWSEHGATIMEEWGLGRRLKPGYLSLFYGPPGTGKTLTATLLAKAIKKPIYRIDLSLIVSKYIGETEKNLSGIFDQAENKNWVLFFDEADALFGKRTKVNDAHDRYANQEVSYLLQRVEDFSGIVILASNLKSNMDEAFTRRFQSVVYFPIPGHEERFNLWKNAFSEVCEFSPEVDLNAIAEQYEISGGSIMNVVRYCSLVAASRGTKVIRLLDIVEGIKREYRKEGKLV